MKAHRLLKHSNLGSRVIKKKSAEIEPPDAVGAETGGGRLSLHGGSLGAREKEKVRERHGESESERERVAGGRAGGGSGG